MEARIRPVLTCLGLLTICIIGGGSLAEAASIVTQGNVRIQALTPTLVRMEFSPTAQFVDEPSVAVINRTDWSDVKLKTRTEGGWLVASTGKMDVRYKLESGPFTAENLIISWQDGKAKHSWKPGDKDDRNLGGVPASMDNRSTKEITDPGPLSRNGYFLLDDSKSALFDKATDWVKPRAEKTSQDWFFFIYETDYSHALGELAKLLGPIPMVPRYIFGSWFGSRASYSAEQWEMIVKQFRDENLPLDVLVLDSDTRAKMIWSGYDWDLEQVPDPKGFLSWMTARGVKVTLNEHYNPLTPEGESNFETIRKAMGMPEGTKEITNDISNKKYAQLFMDLLHKPALDMGMAFWWQDGAAPSTMEGLDSYLWTRHIEYEGSEKITGKRSYAFCRLGSAWGAHRYGGYFTGDLHGVWESLPVLVPATVKGGNMLVPYMNNLCGGVFTVDLPTELYQRWVQFGSMSPIIWFHGLWGLRLPWEYGPEGEQTYRTFVGLRYALIPYLYTYSRIAHETGLPLARGMYIDYPDQDSAYRFDQQYMLGRDLLVAPITAPAKGKTANREVWLPAGDEWFDYFTGDIYHGGQVITHDCPLERMPLFVKASSIIPMAPVMDFSDQKPLDPLTLDIYAGPTAVQTRLYEDDGTSLDYRKNAFAWTSISFDPADQSGSYVVKIEPTQGKFKGQIKKRGYVIKIHGLLKPEAIKLAGTKLPEIGSDLCGEGWNWDARKRVTTVKLARPISTATETLLRIENAGTFAGAVNLQKALNLREQIRQAKRLLKLKHVELTAAQDIKKPPRVIRETEKIERQLDQMVDDPKRIEAKPDFAGMLKHVLDALRDQPFESNRAIPEVDPDAIKTTELIQNGTFTEQEIQRITGLLRGEGLPAWVYPEEERTK